MSENNKVGFFSISLVRGLIGMLVGIPAGMGVVILVRLLMGLPAWNPEPAWVLGAVFGTVAFMLGTGVMNDWIRWAKGEETPEHPEANPNLKGWAKYLSVSFDHKVIGIQYGFTALLLFTLAGIYALTFRSELYLPDIQFLQPGVFNTTVS
jgi:cytochrome c oxidase subunit 1